MLTGDVPAEPLQGVGYLAKKPVLTGLVFVFTAAVLLAGPWVLSFFVPCGDPSCSHRAHAQFYLMITFGAASVYALAAVAWPYVASWKRLGTCLQRPGYLATALSAAVCFLAYFIYHFGNRQFGGYDFSILVDTGWRLATGQRPYLDFVNTPPPGFYLGAKYAFQLFGATWAAQLWFTGLFAGVTFIWLYALCREVIDNRTVALGLAFVVECGAMLTTDFWWYNNTTDLTGAIFFLSCLLYSRKPVSAAAQSSYVVSLALLSLMKPNVAGLFIPGAIVPLLLAVPSKRRLFLLTGVGILISFIFLRANTVSIAGIANSYREAAVGRGFTLFGFRYWKPIDLGRIIVCLILLCVPLLLLFPRFRVALNTRDWRAVGQNMLLLLAPVVNMYAITTNGELKDVEWVAWVAADTILVFESSHSRLRLMRFQFALLVGLLFSDLYMGAVRYRVYTIGPLTYFDWRCCTQIETPFFRNLEASERFKIVLDQIRDEVKRRPGSIFFGPRLEFAYAAFHIASPQHVPVWWHPGTSFAAKDEPALIQIWESHQFDTLIFLKDDFTYYSTRFLAVINDHYARDDHFSELTIMRAKREGR